jgi:methylmalonyl-CoA mutase
VHLARGTEVEKRGQIKRTHDFQAEHAEAAESAIAGLKAAVTADVNVFEVLMDAARVCTLGQITEAFFEVGGAFRRSV